VSGDRVGNILAENANINAQLLDVADTAAVGENIDYQANNNDTHGEVERTQQSEDYVRLREIESERRPEQRAQQRADDVAREEVGRGGVPVEGPPFSLRDRIQPNLPRPLLPVAREEVGGVRELVSGDRVGNILAENANINAQLLHVADTAAVGENIDYQANNNDTHGEVDAPVGDVPPDDIDDHNMANVDHHDPQELVHDSGAAREQLGVHESESEQQFAARDEEEGVGEEINAEQSARDPVGDVILDIGANENIGN